MAYILYRPKTKFDLFFPRVKKSGKRVKEIYHILKGKVLLMNYRDSKGGGVGERYRGSFITTIRNVNGPINFNQAH